MKRIPKKAYLRTDKKSPIVTIHFYNNVKPVSFALPCTHDEAREVLQAINRKIALRIFNVDEYHARNSASLENTLEGLYENYLKFREQELNFGRITQATYDMSNLSLKTFINILGPEFLIYNIEEKEINQFISKLLNSKTKQGKIYSNATINTYLRVLKTVFTWAMHQGLVPENPFLKIKNLPEKRGIRVLSIDEIKKMRDYLSDKPSWQLDAFNFSLWTGCRRESIVTIKESDLFQKNIDGRSETFLNLSEKGRGGLKKDRIIPLSKNAVELLYRRMYILKHRDLQQQIIKEKGNSSYNEIYLNRATEGFLFWEVYKKKSITQAFLRAKNILNIEGVSFHSLRKTFATHYLEQGGSLEALHEILGHSDFNITLRIYSDITLKKLSGEIRNQEML